MGAHQTFLDVHVVLSSKETEHHEEQAKIMARDLVKIAGEYKSPSLVVVSTATVWQKPERHVVVKLKEGDDV